MQDIKDTEKNPGNQADMDTPKKTTTVPGTPETGGATKTTVPHDQEDQKPVKKSA